MKMPSQALAALCAAMTEVRELGSAVNPSLLGRREALRLAKAVGRAQVVLLYSHFERYFYAVNEEAIEFLNQGQKPRENIPEAMRLLHSASVVDEIARTMWEHRSQKLDEFVTDDGWLWCAGGTGILDHRRLMAWMKAPNPKNLIRYYRYWGVEDIFGAITRKESTRQKLWLSVQEFVEKRHNIAHGDPAAQATAVDVRRYAASASEFCTRSDRALARQIAAVMGAARPW